MQPVCSPDVLLQVTIPGWSQKRLCQGRQRLLVLQHPGLIMAVVGAQVGNIFDVHSYDGSLNATEAHFALPANGQTQANVMGEYGEHPRNH